MSILIIYIYLKKLLNIIKYVILFNNIILLTYNKINYYLNIIKVVLMI